MSKDSTQKKLVKQRPRSTSFVIPSPPPELKESKEESINISKSWFQRIMDSKFVTTILNYQIKLEKNGKNLKILKQAKLLQLALELPYLE